MQNIHRWYFSLYFHTKREQEVRKTTVWHLTSCSHEHQSFEKVRLLLDVKELISLPQLFSLLPLFPFTKSHLLFVCHSLVP